jgi:uncharacterized cysteine cluster protein YcgN (CxxCxxCC family)
MSRAWKIRDQHQIELDGADDPEVDMEKTKPVNIVDFLVKEVEDLCQGCGECDCICRKSLDSETYA